MKYFIALFVAVIAVSCVNANPTVVVPSPAFRNLVAAAKPYIEKLLNTLISAVNYILNVFINLVIAASSDTPVAVQPLLDELLALPQRTVYSVLQTLTGLLKTDSSLLETILPSHVGNCPVDVDSIGQQLLATGLPHVRLDSLIDVLSNSVGNSLVSNNIWGTGIVGNGIWGNGNGANSIWGNGILGNGIVGNGVVLNGVLGNGVVSNGVVSNGVVVIGVVGNGVGVNGIWVNGNGVNGILGNGNGGNIIWGNNQWGNSIVDNDWGDEIISDL